MYFDCCSNSRGQCAPFGSSNKLPPQESFANPEAVPFKESPTKENIQQAYTSGLPLHFNAKGILSDDVLSWTYEHLRDVAGDQTMSIAVRTPHVIERFGDLTKQHGGTVPIATLLNYIEEASQDNYFQQGNKSLTEPGFGLDIHDQEAVLEYCAFVMGANTHKPLYAHENVMKVGDLGLDLPMPDLLEDYKEAINMLWIGPSAPDLHQDALDNILFQVQGTKRVWVYPANLTPLFPMYSVFDTAVPNHCKLGYGFRFEEVKQEFPEVAISNLYCVDLQPGEALVIPAGALHAAMGSLKSISVNAFLVPNSVGTLPARGKWEWARATMAMTLSAIRNPGGQMMDYDTTTNKTTKEEMQKAKDAKGKSPNTKITPRGKYHASEPASNGVP